MWEVRFIAANMMCFGGSFLESAVVEEGLTEPGFAATMLSTLKKRSL